MQPYWNLRKLLDADPQTLCHGRTQKGKRCTKPLNAVGRARAESLLNEMDRRKSISFKDLRELVEVLLCREWHNNINTESRKHHSQVEELFAKWSAIVVRESANKKGEVTVDVHEIRRKETKAQRDKAIWEKDEVFVRIKIQQEQRAQAEREKTRLDARQRAACKSKQGRTVANYPEPQPIKADPFISGRENKTEGNLFNGSSSRAHSSSKDGSSKSALKDSSNTSHTTISKNTTANLFKRSSVPAEQSLPSPPSSPLVSMADANKDIAEIRFPAVPTHATKILLPVAGYTAFQPRKPSGFTVLADLKHESTAQSPSRRSNISPAPPSNSFTFRAPEHEPTAKSPSRRPNVSPAPPSNSFTFRTPKPQTPPAFNFAVTAGQKSLSAFSPDFTAALPSVTRPPPTPIPAQRFSGFSFGSLTDTPSQTSKPQNYKTKVEQENSFAPDLPPPNQKKEVEENTPETPESVHVPELEQSLSFASEPPSPKASSEPQTPTATAPITVHAETPAASTVPTLPPTPPEDCGYATITPSPIRYTTYLLSRQQYGLMTPPQSAESTPTHKARHSEADSPLPRPTVERKPLPKPQIEPEVHEEDAGDADEGAGTENERERRVQNGCFSFLRVRSFRRRVGRRLGVWKGRRGSGIGN